MRYLPLFLALRYLKSSTNEKNISLMMVICFITIAIGSFSLALVSAIMQGFDDMMHEKMQGINPPLMLRSQGQPLNIPALTTVIKQEFPEITATSPLAFGHAILMSPEQSDKPFFVMVRGIDPVCEPQVSCLHEKVVIPKSAPLTEVFTRNSVLMGKELAHALAVTPGDHVTLLYTGGEKISNKKVTLDHVQVRVAALFNTGIEDFDSNVIFCSLDFFQTIFPTIPITHLNAAFDKRWQEHDIRARLTARTKLDVLSWQDLYPSLSATLKLEKIVMIFIVFLITLIASMTIIALLFMQIYRKRPDIALLYTIGAPHSLITTLFVIMGLMITMSASIVGIILAAITSYLLHTYHLITLPDIYYTTHLPAHMTWSIAFFVLIVTTLLGFLATIIPTRLLKSMNITHILRYEG